MGNKLKLSSLNCCPQSPLVIPADTSALGIIFLRLQPVPFLGARSHSLSSQSSRAPQTTGMPEVLKQVHISQLLKIQEFHKPVVHHNHY